MTEKLPGITANEMMKIIERKEVGDFFGVCMTGGLMILLGLNGKSMLIGDYVGTGMHGGVIHKVCSAVVNPKQECFNSCSEYIRTQIC